MHYLRETTHDFARRITALGFRVYIARNGEAPYGFIANDLELRVLSFSFNDGSSLHGNYGPPSRESGTGWRLDECPYDLRTTEDVTRALNAHPPAWEGKGWRYLTTVAQYLKTYQDSSRFALFTPETPDNAMSRPILGRVRSPDHG